MAHVVSGWMDLELDPCSDFCLASLEDAHMFIEDGESVPRMDDDDLVDIISSELRAGLHHFRVDLFISEGGHRSTVVEFR
jgi:hypothetical protein